MRQIRQDRKICKLTLNLGKPQQSLVMLELIWRAAHGSRFRYMSAQIRHVWLEFKLETEGDILTHEINPVKWSKPFLEYICGVILYINLNIYLLA